jgi:hypothetical protein
LELKVGMETNVIIQVGLVFVILMTLYSMKGKERERYPGRVLPACPYNCVHKNMGRWYIWNNCWQTCGELSAKDIREAMRAYRGEVFN